MKLEVKFDEQIQGQFLPTQLNLMLAFQVNCPGCFLHAIPQMNSLFEKYQHQVSFFGLSTAFEDFEWNTVEHTRLLTEKGTLVGETKRVMEANGNSTYQHPLKFPVMFDSIVSKHELLEDASLDRAAHKLVLMDTYLAQDIHTAKEPIREYFSSFQKVGHTFIYNWLRGTPSFILFDKNLEILAKWFGEMPLHQVEELIEAQLLKNSPRLLNK